MGHCPGPALAAAAGRPLNVITWTYDDVPEGRLPRGFVRPAVPGDEDEGRRKQRRTQQGDEEGSDCEGGSDWFGTRHVYCATMFCRAAGLMGAGGAEARSVAVRISKFTPSFLLALRASGTGAPLPVPPRGEAALRRHVAGCMRAFRPELRNARVVQRKEFRGFTADAVRDFVRVSFDSRRAMQHAAKQLRCAPHFYLAGAHVQAVLYESTLLPVLRLIHVTGIASSGWVDLDPAACSPPEAWATTDECFTAGYKAVSPHLGAMRYSPAPYVSMCFDIECCSRSGDFPVPAMTYAKVASKLVEAVQESAGPNVPAAKRLARGEVRGVITAYVMQCFGMPPPASTPAAAVAQKLEGTHILIPQNCTRVSLKAPMAAAEAHALLWEISEDVRDLVLSPVRYSEQDRTKTAADHVAQLLDRQLPPLLGDPVVQIGFTLHAEGRDCYHRVVAVFGECALVEDAEVRACATERELLLCFPEMLRRFDPDLVCGYNSHSFDMFYMWTRARELGIEALFMREVGRVRGEVSKFRETELSSSALGDNKIRTIDMPGRVAVDMLTCLHQMANVRLSSYKLDKVAEEFVGEKKHEVSPAEIFSMADPVASSPADRAVVAAYCVQDCLLVAKLMTYFNVVTNNKAMASLCSVPFEFTFTRGQGVKVFSLVAKVCMQQGKAIRDLPRLTDQQVLEESSYEGATVLAPKTGYYESPVAVLDFNSMYPSLMIAHNLSPDTLVLDPAFLGAPGYTYETVRYTTYEGAGDRKAPAGEEAVTFATPVSGEPGVMAHIATTLLSERAATRLQMQHRRVATRDGRVLVGEVREEEEGGVVVDGQRIAAEDIARVEDAYTPAQREVMDGHQLALKVTSNVLYGQMGANGDLRDKRIAASVTALGRGLIQKASRFAEQHGGEVVYGDTDSIFVRFAAEACGGAEGRQAIMPSIRLGVRVAELFSQTLSRPQKLGYEKTFWPFYLEKRKGYAGNKYEHNDQDHKRVIMGLIPKRRDNPQIAKRSIDCMFDAMLDRLDASAAVAELQGVLRELSNKTVPMQDLVITKTLRAAGNYKFPDRVAHYMLALRIAREDLGNAPQPNDRLPYVFCELPPGRKKADIKLVDRMETPERMLRLKRKPDYLFYLENQVMSHALNVLGVILEWVPGYRMPQQHWEETRQRTRSALKAAGTPPHMLDKRTEEAVGKQRQEMARELVFDVVLNQMRLGAARQTQLNDWLVARK
jgi:DNA polymerase elongation subunit (family B)